ncbi:CDT1-like protein a, chloroplastic isoform X3 [Rhodamnia argentea]|uniref:CDT1-like protein a, chloroplastic isoform X3 n=1 Tax=Rhodamnia argentea TaxID=178133 RepID=A0A8B8NHR4_9MYRT|nr:CDT1-like protein a, chloroplastic isoform X3 [Rhodamnia argentea]XP_048139047.1 CDT1-like protein a, chloroplastic isoform X3 [Rhodamnia argentea]
MDQKKCETSGMVTSSEESGFALQTPRKTGEPLRRKTEVAEKYETIVELFDNMTCSLRLLNLCKKSPTFWNVSAQVEVLAKRKFLCSHLAQIKYILPEAIRVEKLLIYDKKTLCMRPDMKITVQLDAIEMRHEQSGFVELRELFMLRLVDYFTDHPEASVVPEAILPGPLHQGNQIIDVQDTLGDSVFHRQSSVAGGVILSEASGLPESFSRHFSQKVVVSENTQLLASPVTFSSSSCTNPTNQELQGRQEGLLNGVCLEPIGEINHNISTEEEASSSCRRSTFIVPSVESPYPCSSVDPITKKSPAVRFSSSSENLTIDTPAQMTPKRSISGCDSNIKSMTSKECQSCWKPAKRSLNFSSPKGERSSIDRSETCKHVHNYSPCSLKLVEEKNLSGFAAVSNQSQENESGHLSKDQISTKRSLRMCQDLSYLNGIAATVNYVFQSVGCSSITREELVHKIIINNFEVLERKEVEEQVELLEKLFPDWFCRRSTHSGDIVYSIKEGTRLESIMARLISS